jgi:hypothetical protein
MLTFEELLRFLTSLNETTTTALKVATPEQAQALIQIFIDRHNRMVDVWNKLAAEADKLKAAIPH